MQTHAKQGIARIVIVIADHKAARITREESYTVPKHRANNLEINHKKN